MKIWQTINFMKDGKLVKKYKFCKITLLRKETSETKIKWTVAGIKITKKKRPKTKFALFFNSLFENYKQHRKRNMSDYQLIATSKYFDKKWYLKTNPDIEKAGIDPIWHYLNNGWKEGLNPSPKFDGDAYLTMYKTVKDAHINPLLHYEKYGYIAKLTIKEPFIINFPQAAENFTVNNLSSKKHKINKIAVFASYSADGKIPDYVIYYLKGLKKICDIIIFVSDNPLFRKEADKLAQYVDYAEISRHGEYDFGSYKRGYQIALANNLLQKAEELIFCNDSCYGPIYPFKRMFNTMKNNKSDFWGICANDEFNYHLQSYFLVFKKNVFTSVVFADFINSVKKEANVSAVVLKYEVKFTHTLQSAGFKCDSFIPFIPDNDVYPYTFSHNLTVFPITLIKNGCPLLKVKALTKLGCNYEGMQQTYDYLCIKNPKLATYLPQPTLLAQNIAFSIIMPTYNRKPIIAKAIDSLLHQTYQNFELIIVDDGSTDNTNSYLQKYYAKEIASGKIKYFYKENSGVCKSRNYGLLFAENEWIAYLDSDNLLYPHYLEMFVQHIMKHKNKIFYAQLRTMSNRKILGSKFNYKKLLKANYIDLGVFIHHRSIYQKLGGFDENMTRLVDWDLIARYTKKYKPFFISKPVILYNDLDNHTRISNSASYNDNFRYFKKKHCHLDLCTITTIITAYNQENYIRQAIESAVKQSGDFIHEIIISDDASSDRTPEIIADYADKYPHLIRNISSRQNVGISKNMQRCFEAANGKYVAVLEGDDYWTDNYKLDKQKNFLEQHIDCTMVFSKLNILNQNTGKITELLRQNNLPNKLTAENIIKEPTLNLMANFSCCMFRTDIMKNLPLTIYNPRLNEVVLSFYLTKMGKIGYISTPLSVYRQHSASTWTGADQLTQLEIGLKIRQKALEICALKYKKFLQKIIDEQYIKVIADIKEKAKFDSAV